jgi:hypothetical protein
VTNDLRQLTTRQLLRLYSDILSELVSRQVIRSRNAPLGDLAEWLVVRAYEGQLAPPSAKSWDVEARGRRLQVKARLIATEDRRSHNYSVFRSYDFDACVFLILDAHSYDVVQAVELSRAAVETLARETAWVKGSRIGTKVRLLDVPGAVDVSSDIRRALDLLDAPPEPATHAR